MEPKFKRSKFILADRPDIFIQKRIKGRLPFWKGLLALGRQIQKGSSQQGKSPGYRFQFPQIQIVRKTPRRKPLAIVFPREIHGMNRQSQRPGFNQQSAGGLHKNRLGKINGFGCTLGKILSDIQKAVGRDAVLNVKQLITDIRKQFDRCRQRSKSLPSGIIAGAV